MQWRARWEVRARQAVLPPVLDRMPAQAFAVAGLPGRRYRGEGVRIQGEPNVIDILSEGCQGQLAKLRPERAVPAQPFRWLGDREANLDVAETVFGQSVTVHRSWVTSVQRGSRYRVPGDKYNTLLHSKNRHF